MRRTQPLGKKVLLPVVLLLAMPACRSTTGPTGRLTVNFQLASSSAAPAVVASPNISATVAAASLTGPIDVTGTNGTLTLEDVRLVVDEFKLEREEGACEDGTAEDSCERFEALPHFLTVPLEEGTTSAFSEDVPPGTYVQLKFEVKEEPTLLGQIQEEFPNWPAEASVLVSGSFASAEDGDPVPFLVYFASGEVKVQFGFDPPLVIAETDAEQSVTVLVDPALWFANADGTVLDLSQFDFYQTGQLLKLEVKRFGDVFTKIEIGG